MGLALAKQNVIHGMPRRDFEAALLHIGDCARLAEQKLILKVDRQIRQAYIEQKKDIEQTTLSLKSLHIQNSVR